MSMIALVSAVIESPNRSDTHSDNAGEFGLVVACVVTDRSE
ncbi:MAG: hypothetical protein ACI9N0_002377 [Ilumatobacter sp.]|jgi:hypothetical protein